MTRFRYLLTLIVMLALLLNTGCLHVQHTTGVTKETPITRHAIMKQLLGAVTNTTQDTLEALDFTISDGADALGTTGLSGPAADAILVDLASYHPSIISAITYDHNGTVLSAEPASARVLIGQNIRDQHQVQQALATREPVMSALFSLLQGGEGVAIAHPVFSRDGEYLGVVSTTFSPYALIAPVAGEAMTWAPFTFNIAQTDGRILYNADPELVGKQTFNEQTFADFPEILNLAQQYSTNRSGYATFAFYLPGTDVIVQKETFWSTTGLHGTEWRVLIIGEM